MITHITDQLYSDIPGDTLYHYTTFKGLIGIVKTGTLWASDIRYMNDSAELMHTADLIRQEVSLRITRDHANPDLLNRFIDWVSNRITNGHLLFGASFRSNGNLLSQWRGYSSLGKGVSIGFNPSYVLSCAEKQSFQVGKCIYDPLEQCKLIKKIIDAVETLAKENGLSHEKENKDSPEFYHQIFEQIEGDLLRIAAILKHPSFQEEEEWRIVSPAVTDFMTSSVQFREGTSMLVPYMEFELLPERGKSLCLEHMFLGPTSNINISMNSLSMFLTKHHMVPDKGISYCQIPYRGQ